MTLSFWIDGYAPCLPSSFPEEVARFAANGKVEAKSLPYLYLYARSSRTGP